uniref:Neural cell adhesion molecule L1-like protein n=1 Tax=Capra hircus TaxID=9925 RepID=A0A8C2S813_CAPHI
EEGDPIVLPCNPPKGLPPLHIYWMNIEHIKQDERVYMSQKGDLYFANVEEQDSRNDYCCFAAFPRLRTIVQKMPMKLTVNSSNSIKQRKPRLLLPPPESGSESSITVLKGDTLLLECFAEGLPTPKVAWDKMGGDLPKGGESKNNSVDTLKIENVSYEDKGNYRCTANNFLGSATHEFHVTVEEPPRWTKKPQSGVYSTGSSGILLCEAEGRPEPTIKWRVNGLPIERNPFSGDVISPGEISFTNVQPNHTAVYQCEASNVHGTILANANIDVVGKHVCVLSHLSHVLPFVTLWTVDVPDPPENLHLSERQNRSVRLTWEAGDDHNSNIKYIVEFEGNKEEPGRWEELTRVQGKETTVVLSLAPYVRYQFRVIAMNEVGRSQPSHPSGHHETPPAAPDKNPQNIRVQASQPKEMIIKWEPLKAMEQNGPGLEYRVTWKPQGAPVEWEEETVTNHTLRVMTPAVYAPYDVQVQAINHLGSGPEPQSVILYSGEDYPDTAPVIQGVDVINSTLVKVTWSTVPKERVHGHLKGYQVNWWKTKSLLDGRTHPKEVNILRFSGQRNYGMVPSLDAFSEFHLTVLAYNSKGAGPESEPFIFQTPEGVPEQPTFLKVIKVDKDTATLSWGLPKKLNGNLTGYLLQYQIINDTDEIGELHDINITTPSKPSWRLLNLSATTKYKFYLRACTSKGCGKPITEESATLGEGKYAGLYDDISTQGWFIGLMCAIALLTLILLTVCFVKRNKGGKYSVKEKEDLHPDPEVQSAKDETFGEYSDSDEKPLKGSLRSLNRDMQATESADSLVEYGEGDHGLFNEDGSFIGAYAGSKEKGSVESNGSSTATFPLRNSFNFNMNLVSIS